MKIGYYQIHVEDVDVEKMAMKIKYNFYEFLVIHLSYVMHPFTFTTLMNLIFHEKLNEFVIIYIDDILVYSKSTEEYATHLEFVLQKFKENKLYANQAKSKCTSLEMEFLGHVLSWETVKPILRKIESIKEWQSLVLTKGVRSFLRLADFYTKFIKDFFCIGKIAHQLLEEKKIL